MKSDTEYRAASLAVCIVAHNEAANIERTLRSVIGWAGEVIVLDCESTDGTFEIAERTGAEAHRGPNLIPEASKNFSVTLASLEWVFVLDADEVIPEDLKREIEQTIARNPVENGFKIPRRNFYFGVPLMHGGNYPDRQLRLFRRGTGGYPGVAYHERIAVDGEVGLMKHAFDHHPYPTFEVWFRKFEWYTRYEASVLSADRVPINARTIRRHMITTPLRRWVERLILKKGYKDGVPGVLAATFDLMTRVVGFGRYWETAKSEREQTGGK